MTWPWRRRRAVAHRTITHASCTQCQPEPSPGRRFLATCGTEAQAIIGIAADLDDCPPDRFPCPACLEVIDHPCVWCGAG